MTDLPVTPWESLQDADPLEDSHADWLDHRETVEQEHRDRMERFADPHGDSFTGCVACHQRAGKLVYGIRCQQCFEAGREAA